MSVEDILLLVVFHHPWALSEGRHGPYCPYLLRVNLALRVRRGALRTYVPNCTLSAPTNGHLSYLEGSLFSNKLHLAHCYEYI